MSIEFCGLEFQNPFLLASGPATARSEVIERAFDLGWAGAVTKALGSKPRANPQPRIDGISFRGKKIGIENIETVIYPLEDWLPKVGRLKENYPDKILIANLMEETDIHDWQKSSGLLQDAGFDMIEVNLSCPLTEEERTVGTSLGQDPQLVQEIAKGVKEVTDIPVMIKLSPNVTDLGMIAKAAERGGADALTLINTVSGFIGVDLETMEPKPSINGMSAFGGYSGPAIKPIALRCVVQAAKETKLPISGVGGISTWRDAMEFLMTGASTVQLCTAVMFPPYYSIIEHLIDGVSNYLKDKGFNSVKDIVGYILPKLTSTEKLDFTYQVIPQVDEPKCIKCRLCYLACRDAGCNAIKLDEKNIPVINSEKCDGCGLCAQVCPVEGAISLKAR